MPEPDFFLKVGDTSSVIYSTLTDADGTAVDIQGADVQFKLAPIDGSGTPAIDAVASNDQVGDGTDGSMGNVSYAWTGDQTSVAGWYLGEWEVTYASSAVQTFPNGGYILVAVQGTVL